VSITGRILAHLTCVGSAEVDNTTSSINSERGGIRYEAMCEREKW
jgi:hypothetical protein